MLREEDKKIIYALIRGLNQIVAGLRKILAEDAENKKGSPTGANT